MRVVSKKRHQQRYGVGAPSVLEIDQREKSPPSPQVDTVTIYTFDRTYHFGRDQDHRVPITLPRIRFLERSGMPKYAGAG